MAVETNETKVWNQLVEMNKTGTINYVGGMIEEYENEWGFRFVPKSIHVYSLDKMVFGQAPIKEISENLDTSLEQQFPIAYVKARVVEIHES